MSVLIVTSLGDIVVDLYADKCPLTSKNFLKLCKIKYYNGCLFHTVQKDFTAQTGDPTGTGTGGDSVYKFLYGDQARFFNDEIHLDLKHSKTGTLAMASAGENLNASQFYLTLRDDLDYLDGKHTVFGEVAEGLETLTRINEAYADEKGRPYKNIRIKHTYILDDPFDDPPQLAELTPGASPEGKPKDEVDDEVRLEDDWVPMDEQLGTAELEELLRAKDAHSRAVVLESIGDIPDAEIKPPDNVLFVCKLNPVTEDEDLHTIFSRFGTVTLAEIIRDYKTGDSLCYAFIEFETNEACEQAYFKMDNALIDDRRIHVDFSQSVSKLWSQYRRKDAGKGKGCFKCGELDHMAKDCTGGPGLKQQQPAKYTLKDDNKQHGGSRYEMVFDEDSPKNPRREKSHRAHDRDEQVEKRRVSPGDLRHGHTEQKGSRDNHLRPSDKSRGHREDERGSQASKASQYSGNRRDRDEFEEQRNRENYEKRRELDDRRRKERDRDDGGKVDKVDTSKRRSRYSDSQVARSDDNQNDNRRVDEGSGNHAERSKYEESYQKRSTGDDRGREERDYRKKDGHRQDTRDEPSHRKRNGDDDDGYKRTEDQEQTRRRSRDDDDYHREKRLHVDRR